MILWRYLTNLDKSPKVIWVLLKKEVPRETHTGYFSYMYTLASYCTFHSSYDNEKCSASHWPAVIFWRIASCFPQQFLADDTQLLMKSWPEGGTTAKDPPKVPLLQIGCVRLGAARSVLSRDCKCGFRHSFISRFPDYIGGDVFYSPLGNSEIWFVERS